MLMMLLPALFARPLVADPWVNAGDSSTRHHLQYLHDQGRIHLSLATWPIAWADIDRELREIRVSELNTAETWSYHYLVHERVRAKKNTTLDKSIFGANSLRPFASFGDIQHREESFVRSGFAFHTGHFAGKLQTEYFINPLENDDQKLRAEGSFIAATSGNWIYGIGAIDRWWGPGWHSSLILSGSSRAPAALFISRKESLPIELPVLSLLGQWNFHAFASVLEEDRPISEPVFAGFRATSSPFDNLEIGMSRTAIVDGDSNPDYLSEDQSVEESYQLISYDARLTGYLHAFNAAIYGQYLEKRVDASDEAENSSLVGVEIAKPFWGMHNRFVFEVGTQHDFNEAADLSLSPYVDEQYPFGYSYRARGIAENEFIAENKTSISGEHHFKGGQIFRWKWQKIDNVLIANAAEENTTIQDQQYINAEFAFPLGQRLLVNFGAFSLKEKMNISASEFENGGYLGFNFRF